jgi:hypothetical protein
MCARDAKASMPRLFGSTMPTLSTCRSPNGYAALGTTNSSLMLGNLSGCCLSGKWRCLHEEKRNATTKRTPNMLAVINTLDVLMVVCAVMAIMALFGWISKWRDVTSILSNLFR